MQLIFYAAIGLILLSAVMTETVQRAFDTPKAVVSASAQVDQYRLFMYVASQYMRSYTAGAGTITWSTLKTVATAPSGAKNMNMPANWKVVAGSDNTWVACTELEPRAIGAIQQLAVQGGQTLNNTQIGGTSFVVIGSATDTGKAAQCN